MVVGVGRFTQAQTVAAAVQTTAVPNYMKGGTNELLESYPLLFTISQMISPGWFSVDLFGRDLCSGLRLSRLGGERYTTEGEI